MPATPRRRRFLARGATLACALAVSLIASPIAAHASDAVDLTPGADAACPLYSPDGSHIAYSQVTPDGNELVIMGSGGSSPVKIPDSLGYNCDASFAPDGTQVTFIGHTGASWGPPDVFVAATDGSATTNLDLRDGDFAAQDIEHPDWSPDGNTIAFDATTIAAPNYNVYAMDPGGTNITPLTTDTGDDGSRDPRYSPDGSKIAFLAARNGCSTDNLFVMDPDGQNQTEIDSDCGDSVRPSPIWSSDGTKLAVSANIFGWNPPQVFVLHADGSGLPAQLTTMGSKTSTPGGWSADGQTVYFTMKGTPPDVDVYAAPADGSVPDGTRITANSASDTLGSVTPDGLTMALASDRECTMDVWTAPTSGDTDTTSHCPDTTAPTVSLVRPGDGDVYSYHQSVEADYSCNDVGSSGLASCAGDADNGAAVDTQTSGTHDFTVTAQDGDGNTTSATHSYAVVKDSASGTVAPGGSLTTDPGGVGPSSDVPVQTTVTTPTGGAVSIDTTTVTQPPPAGYTFLGKEIHVTAPDAADAQHPLVLTFALDQGVGADAATLRVARNGRLVAECSGPAGTASPDPCASVAKVGGVVTATVLTTQASTWNFGVHDAFAFDGYRSPLKNPPTLNVVSAGAGVPVIFSLGGKQGLDVLAHGSPTSKKISCPTGATTNKVKQTTTATTLAYNKPKDQYTYPWATQTSWKNTCRSFTMELADGTTHVAKFQFKK